MMNNDFVHVWRNAFDLAMKGAPITEVHSRLSDGMIGYQLGLVSKKYQDLTYGIFNGIIHKKKIDTYEKSLDAIILHLNLLDPDILSDPRNVELIYGFTAGRALMKWNELKKNA